MKDIIIAFKKIKKDSNIICKLIGLKEKTKYCHVEIAFEYECNPGTYKSVVAIGGKGDVHYEDRKFEKEDWDIMKLPVSCEAYENAKRICDGYIGHKYDFLGIFGFILPFKDRSNEWFCSEIAANTLKYIGVAYFKFIEASDVGIRKLLDLLDFDNNKIKR